MDDFELQFIISMQIPLKQFEQIIDEAILKRGLAYFKKGAVSDLTEISVGEYEAIGSGTEEYAVRIEIKNDTIIDHHCDCPYDMGPVCKHVVAVIFYLQQGELELNQKAPSSRKTSRGIKRDNKKSKSLKQQVRDLLKSIPHDELILFVEEHCNKDRGFKNHFLASFGHLSQGQSKGVYQKQIRAILRSAAGREGFVSWTGMRHIVNSSQVFLENAEQYLAKKDYKNVFFISTALLEEMTDALSYADDSNGDLGYFVDSAMELLAKLTQEDISRATKQEIFEYCIATFKKNLFKGWDWHLGMLHIAGDLADGTKEVDIVLACLKSLTDEYESEFAQAYTLELLRRYKDPKEVEEYAIKHISNSGIREQEIRRAFESKNFERAVELANDGIRCDEQNRPGLVTAWYDWLLRVAIAQNDIPNIINYARYRLIDNFGSTQDYYQILKRHIEPGKWHSFLEEIITEITPKGKWTYIELIRQIYIKEEWWDRLFLLVKKNLSLENIQNNEQYLAKEYSAELVGLYSERIRDYVDKYLGRNNYQTACRYLRRMKKLGGSEQVNELVELFRKQYPQRKALMDELNRV